MTSVQDMIARFRNGPARSREERQAMSSSQGREGEQPRLWWERGTKKSALRDIGSDSINEKYGLLKGDNYKIGSRVEKMGKNSTLLDRLFAAAEAKEDEHDMQRQSASYARHSNDSVSRFRASLRDSWGAGGEDARFPGGRTFASSSNDMVNMRTSNSGTFGPGMRALMRSELRLDGSNDYDSSDMQRSDGYYMGLAAAAVGRNGPDSSTRKVSGSGGGGYSNSELNDPCDAPHDAIAADMSPRDLSKVPGIQAGLDDLLSKLRGQSDALQKKYDAAVAPAPSATSTTGTQVQQAPTQSGGYTEQDWARIIVDIEKNSLDLAAIEARDKERRDKARQEQDRRMMQVGMFEEQWRQMFPVNGDGGVAFALPVTAMGSGMPAAHPEPFPQQPEDALRHSHDGALDHTSSRAPPHNYNRTPHAHPDDPSEYFHRSADRSDWVLRREDDADPDEHWRHSEYNAYMRSQRQEEVVVSSTEQIAGRGCWQGFGKFASVDILEVNDSQHRPRWVQQSQPMLITPVPPNEGGVCDSSIEHVPLPTLALSASALPQRLQELEAAEGEIQRQIEQHRQRMQRTAPLSPRTGTAAAPPLSPRTATASAPPFPRPASPRRETFSILQGRPALPLHLALDYTLDTVLGREGRGPPRATLGKEFPPRTHRKVTLAPAAARVRDSPSKEANEEQWVDYVKPSTPAVPEVFLSSSGVRARASDLIGMPTWDSWHEKEKYLEQMRRRRREIEQHVAAVSFY